MRGQFRHQAIGQRLDDLLIIVIGVIRRSSGHGDDAGPRRRSRLLRTDRIGGLIALNPIIRSEEHTSELQSLMRISYAVFCLKKKNTNYPTYARTLHQSYSILYNLQTYIDQP